MKTPEAQPIGVREGRLSGYVRGDLNPQPLLQFIRDFRAGKKPIGARRLAEHAGKYAPYFIPLPFAPWEVFMKHFRHRRISRIVFPFLGASDALHSWKIALELRRNAACCPRPVAVIEYRIGPAALDSYFLTEWIEPGVPYVETAAESIITGEMTEDEMFRELAGFLAEMHRRGVCQSGLHAGNVLWERLPSGGRRLLLIDLDRTWRRRAVSLRERMRMLCDAYEGFLLLCEPERFREFVACYSEAGGIPMTQMNALLPAALDRLRRAQRQLAPTASRYVEGKIFSALACPVKERLPSGPPGVRIDFWNRLCERVRNGMVLCVARRNLGFLGPAAPKDWAGAIEQDAKAAEAEADLALRKFLDLVRRLENDGVEPVVIGSLPLLNAYECMLDPSHLTPFQIVLPPGRTAQRGGPGRGVEFLRGIAVEAMSARLDFSHDMLRERARECRVRGTRLLVPPPEVMLLYYAASCAAPGHANKLHAMMDFAVFVNAFGGALDLREAVSLARKAGGEELLWHAFTDIRCFINEPLPVERELLRRLRSADGIRPAAGSL